MPTGESLSDLSYKTTALRGQTFKGSAVDRQRAYLDARLTAGALSTKGSVADKQVRLGLKVREIMKSGDIT